MNFAEIVRSSAPVRGAFIDTGAVSLWWRLILALHGKPTSKQRNTYQLRRVLAGGFRFYAQLYAGLSVAMLVAAGAIGFSGVSAFWGLLLLVSSFYLIAIAQLAFVGARNFATGKRRGSVQLVAFFVAVIAFLSCFCGIATALAQFAYPSQSIMILLSLSILLTLGVGSYVIEIVYLVNQTPADPTP